MIDSKRFTKIGVQVAWAGYPVIAHPNLYLFTGTIAAFISHDDSYLIDGVAINGVSGGPVFTDLPGDQPEVLGTISAYMPNRQLGDTLPGMLHAHDVTSFQKRLEKSSRSTKSERKGRTRRNIADGKKQSASLGPLRPCSPLPGSIKHNMVSYRAL